MASLWNPLITIISTSPCYLLNSLLQGNYTGSLPYLHILEGLGVKLFHISPQQRKETLCSLWRPVWHFALHHLLLLRYMWILVQLWAHASSSTLLALRFLMFLWVKWNVKAVSHSSDSPARQVLVEPNIDGTSVVWRGLVFTKDIPFPVDLI